MPREAAEGAEFVFSMLTDYDASKAVWITADTGALAGLYKDAIAIVAARFRPNGSGALPRPWRRAAPLYWMPQSWDRCRKLKPPSSLTDVKPRHSYRR